jgi:DNA repair exonuclease SbcCD ATPase subunit
VAQELRAELQSKADQLTATSAELKAERDRLQAFSDSLSKLDELQGQNKTLEQQFEFLLRRNAELEEANGKLVQHNNHKQKLQYHLQIKQGLSIVREIIDEYVLP